MEIKSRESTSPLQWLSAPAQRFLSSVSIRTWIFVIVAICVVALAFYAGGKPRLRKPVAQFVNTVVTLQFLSEADKYVKGILASPRSMQIDIKHTNYQKLLFKRDEAFKRGIIVTTDESYVPAEVTVDGRSYRVRMRLKGDYPDHLTGDKWSFRIITKGESAVFGMKRFSIQDPTRSGWLKEWIMYKWYAYEDLIALRYDYIDVTINGRDLGIFTIEESFGKQLIEHNKRPEGPILKFDESFWLDKSSTNLGDRASQSDVYHAADITSFNTSKTMKTEKLRNNFLAGRALLTELRSGQKTLSEVMDVQRAARTFAISDILSDYHGMRWKNSRFYFNPVTARIEFIAYNMYAASDSVSRVSRIAYQRWLDGGLSKNHVEDWIDAFFSDEKFVTAYFEALNRMVSPGYLEQFFESISTELTEKMHILYKDGYTNLASTDDYLRNRDLVYQLLHPNLRLKAYFKNLDVESGTLTLTVANTAFLPVEFEAVECRAAGKLYDDIEPIKQAGKTAGAALEFLDIEVGGVEPEDSICTQVVDATGDSDEIGELRLRYKILGADESQWTTVDAYPIELASEYYAPETSDTSILIAAAPSGMIRIDDGARRIAIQPGYWKVTRDLVFPAGYQVIGSAGTTVDLNEGAALISYSSLRLIGSADAPFVIRTSDGSGQGIAVIGANERSTLSHVLISGNGAVTRDSWTLTGTITFYESDVSLANVNLETNNAEDMVNLIRSNYTIRDSRFVSSAFDALDIDFSDGIIEKSFFKDCGNDCIDFSGSISTLSDIEIDGAGDKGVSVGEQSSVNIADSRIRKTHIGLASKDGSIVDMEGVTISNVTTGLASYQKKPEYSGATLSAMDVILENTETPYFVQRGSAVFHDGIAIAVTPDH